MPSFEIQDDIFYSSFLKTREILSRLIKISACISKKVPNNTELSHWFSLRKLKVFSLQIFQRYLMKELRLKIFPLFRWIKQCCIRNFEGLEHSKLLEISQTRFSYSSQRCLRVLTSFPPKIFEQQFLPLQTTSQWKENLTVSRIHFKNWNNILNSELSCNFHKMILQRLQNACSKKCPTFWNMNIRSGDLEYIITFMKIWVKTGFMKLLKCS